jgi:superfamily II DNA or RNA helicase
MAKLRIHLGQSAEGEPVFFTKIEYQQTRARKALHRAGFHYAGESSNVVAPGCVPLHGWWTKKLEAAAHFLDFADPDAKAVLLPVVAHMAGSRATDCAEFDPTLAPRGKRPYGFQKAGVTFALRRYAAGKKGVLIADEMGLGKAQPLNARLLTPAGWTTMGAIRVGDLVIGSDGKPTEVTGVFNQGVKEIFRVVFSDGSATECCDEHLWLVNSALRKWQKSAPRALPLSQIRKKLTLSNGNRLHYIPLVAPVAFEGRTDFVLDPYLLGALLGDGGIAHQVIFSSADADMIETIRALLPPGHSIKHHDNYDWGISGTGRVGGNIVRNELRRLGLFGKKSETKFIPDEYKYASAEVRQKVLQGLLDTDGHVRPADNNIEYSSSSKRLAGDVQFLVESLGGTAKIRPKKTKCLPSYRMSVALPSQILPFRLPRKADVYHPRGKYPPSRSIVSVIPVGRKRARCISVAAPDHLYVTDRFILTHNTIQAILVANSLPLGAKILVLCPASVISNWGTEWARWDTRGRRVSLITDARQKPGTDVLVMNYDRFATALGDDVTTALMTQRWSLIIMDESHKLKNPASKRSRNILGHYDRGVRVSPGLIHVCERVLALTGTPVENRVKEFLPLLRGLDAEVARDEIDYLFRFCGAVQRRDGAWDFEGSTRCEQLQDALRSDVMVRRLKSQVFSDMPPKIRTVASLDCGGDGETYRKRERSVVQGIDKLEADVSALLKVNADFAKAVSSLTSKHCPFQEVAALRAALAVVKAPAVCQYVSNLLGSGNSKLIVFGHHKILLDVLSRCFNGRSTVRIDGTTDVKKRQAIVDAFQTDPRIRLAILSTRAAGIGLNLTAAPTVVFAEADWNPTWMQQAEDRVHRIGQTAEVVNIHYLIVDGTLDAHVIQTAVAKMDIAERVLDTEHDLDAKGIVAETWSDPEEDEEEDESDEMQAVAN